MATFRPTKLLSINSQYKRQENSGGGKQNSESTLEKNWKNSCT